MSCFYDLEKPGTFGVPNRTLRDTGAGIFKIHKTGNVPGQPETNEIPSLQVLKNLDDVNVMKFPITKFFYILLLLHATSFLGVYILCIILYSSDTTPWKDREFLRIINVQKLRRLYWLWGDRWHNKTKWQGLRHVVRLNTQKCLVPIYASARSSNRPYVTYPPTRTYTCNTCVCICRLQKTLLSH
jgi:hypothetical protein